MSFTFTPLAIPDVVLIETTTFGDARGAFRETFRDQAFAAAGIPTSFVQDNLSRSALGVVRGIHFQRPPHAQGKLVSCPFGRVFDVAVDLRAGSPTFGRWVGAELSGDNGSLLWVPPGFGHGFASLAPDSLLAYKVTDYYSGPHDGAIAYDDPEIGVEWGVDDPVLSDKDRSAPRLADCDHGFTFGPF
jgi:dTDP-4-dehydrorhamnose 3,5-epimerase